MSPARISAPASVSRWTDEEHDILVDLTNEQLALEAQDNSKVIPWARHWDNVSTQLHKAGYSRTSAACLGYWKRTVGAQKANEKAAGPRWEDEEHRVLLGMTEEQLELEETDPSATMPWARHWKKVSERLKEHGYTRSVDACDAYWNLVQDNSPLAGGVGNDDQSEASESEEVEAPFEVNCGIKSVENRRSSRVEKTPEPPSKSVENRRSSRVEKSPEPPSKPVENRRSSRVEKTPEPPSKTDAERPSPSQSTKTPKVTPKKDPISPELMKSINEMIRQEGYTPNPNEFTILRRHDVPKQVYLQWVKEEQQTKTSLKSPPQPSPKEQQQAKMSSRSPPQPSLSARWSSVNGHVGSPAISESASVEAAKAPSLKSDLPQTQVILQDEPIDVSQEGSSKKPKTTAFRFSPDQRAFLEEEAARNGANPGQDRRMELANQLRVEEKTVRNWFVHHRQRSTRRSLENRPRDASHDSAYSLAMLAVKRTRGSLDGIDAIEVIPPSAEDSAASVHQAKRPRLEPEFGPDITGQAQIENPTGEPINIIRKVPPRDFRNFSLDEPPPPHRASPVSIRPAEAQGNPLTLDSMVQTGKQPGSPLRSGFRPVSQPLHQRSFGADSTYSKDAESPQPNPAPLPPSNVEGGYTISMIMNKDGPPTVIRNGEEPTHFKDFERGMSKDEIIAADLLRARSTSNMTTTQSQELDFKTPQPRTTPQTDATPITDETEKAWLSSKVQKLQSDIEALKREDEARLANIRSIDQQLDNLAKDSGGLQRMKEEEIARVLREIEDRYRREYEGLNQKQYELGGAKESEVAALNRNLRQITKNEKKMRSYQTLVDLDGDSDDGR